ARRLLVRRDAGVVARLSGRRKEPRADHERGQLPRREHRSLQLHPLRRSRSLQVSDCVRDRARLVGDHRGRRARDARLHAQGRLHHRRRLQSARAARLRRVWRRTGRGVRARAAVRRRRLAELRSFHSFFEINRLDNFPQAYIAGNPIFKSLYEENNPEKRIMMIVNYNTDISQYWEWSGRGFRPFDETNEAYKLGVNYLIYGLTH